MVCFALLLVAAPLQGQEVPAGYRAQVPVTAPTRLDYVFPLANQSPATTPDGWLKDYDSKKQTYEQFVPNSYDPKRTWPLVLFVSAGNRSTGFRAWQEVCEQQGVLFAGPHGAGNATDMRQRVRIVLDVLDDMRRKFHIDPDRTYISGFSGGGRIACQLGFSLPEVFGGVVPLCAAGELRKESWLRHRAIDRLSVALVTGENDFNRGEVERFRGPLLRDLGVRTRIDVQPGLGHGMPSAAVLSEVYQWLEAGTKSRQALAEQYPASRAGSQNVPSRPQAAAALLQEARSRLEQPETLYSGLMQLQGVMVRWNDLPEAKQAREILLEYDADPNAAWRNDDIAEQRQHLIARARALDAYASGPLPETYQKQRPAMLKAAIALWQQVLADGQDDKAVREADVRLPVLRKELQQSGE